MNASSTSKRTKGQEENYRRIITDAARKAADLAVSKIEVNQEGWQLLLRRGKELADAIRDTVMSKTRELSFAFGDQVSAWVKFYQKHFNLELDLSNLKIPEHQEGFDRLLIVAKGMTPNIVYTACEKQFPCWRYREDLDKDVPDNDRDPKHGTYAIWVRDRVEADEENKNQSADQRRQQGCTDETLLERELHELKFFDETGKHLDIKNWTLCTGSRRSCGSVPSAGWDGGGFIVVWRRSGARYGDMRARSVVSLPAEASEAQPEQA